MTINFIKTKKKLKHFFLSVICIVAVFSISAQETFTNPILPGYHPDPSICRVGDDYYLVNSTFVWFPGLPIYHSKDLVNWELIGHGIDRPNVIDLNGLPDKLGLFAPTIRHHDGLFYIINTCVGCKMNFYITATNPAGPWSDPIWLPEAPGIDPSLMWDDDGKCYYTGHNGLNRDWPTQCEIWNQELDLEQKKLVGERHHLTYGHANNASYTEGPHLYKVNGKYLLMVAEGGTGMYHALSVHHSDSINGPYITDHINPIISHRHLGRDYPIHAIGHGDLVETQNGEWWLVALGNRHLDKKYSTLGRETFLAKVEFEGQTPIVNPGHGKVLKEQTRPNLPWSPVETDPIRDNFNEKKIALKWCTIRTPEEEFYSVKDGSLKLKLRKEVMDSLVNSSILIQRIEHHNFEASTKMSFKTKKMNEQAGLTIYRTNENHYKLIKDKNSIVLLKGFKGKVEEIERVPYSKNEVILHAAAKGLDVQFSYGETENKLTPIGNTQSLIIIASGQGNAQFNGPGIGVYATSNGVKTNAVANFDWFEYKAK